LALRKSNLYLHTWRDDAAIFFWTPKGSQFYDNEIASSRLERESQ
jgi:hypothetical protein